MFCKNCGNKLDDDDKVCAVCGETVDGGPSGHDDTVNESSDTEIKSKIGDDIKTPLFDFKWNVHDFPQEESIATEDIDFKWKEGQEPIEGSSIKDTPIVEKMKGAVDADEIAATPTFSDGEQQEDPITDEWYEPFSMKKSTDDETMFKINKKNAEFQELLDKEFEKYGVVRNTSLPNEATKRYNVNDFRIENYHTPKSESYHIEAKPAEPIVNNIENNIENNVEEDSDNITDNNEHAYDNVDNNEEHTDDIIDNNEEHTDNIIDNNEEHTDNIIENHIKDDIEKNIDEQIEEHEANLSEEKGEPIVANIIHNIFEPSNVIGPEFLCETEDKDDMEKIKDGVSQETVSDTPPVGPIFNEMAGGLFAKDLVEGQEAEQELEPIEEDSKLVDDKELIAEPEIAGDIAGMRLFATSFASPMDIKVDDKSISKSEGSKNMEADISELISAELETPQSEIIRIEQSDSITSEPEEEEEASVDNNMGIFDTSFASPFAFESKTQNKVDIKVDTPEADVTSEDASNIDKDEFLKDLPSGDEVDLSEDQIMDAASKLAAMAIDSQSEQKADGRDDNKEGSKPVESKVRETMQGLPRKKSKVVGPEIIDEPVVFPFGWGMDDEADEPEKDEEADEPEKDEEAKPAKQKDEKIEARQSARPKADEPPKVTLPPMADGFDIRNNFRIDDDFSVSSELIEQVSEQKDEQKKVNEPEKVVEPPKVTTEISPPKQKENNAVIKVLVVLIIIIAIILAGIGVMKLAPDTTVGIVLNHVSNAILGTEDEETSGTAVSGTTEHIAPYADGNSLVESQLFLNRNIRQVVYDDTARYDEAVSYKISGASNSQPIENDHWKLGTDGPLLFDEQIVRTIIGYNSSWVDFVNGEDMSVFDYVVPGSKAEDSLKREKLGESQSVIYNTLGIGEIRQNGNKFYVWTNETISIKSKKGKNKEGTIKQLYELEATSDSLQITTIVLL